MTIFDYLATIDADYENPGTKLQAFVDHATPEEVQSAGGLPYAIVEHLDENPEVELYGHRQVIGQLVDVTLYQKPENNGVTPDRKKIIAVWHEVMAAVGSVDEHTYKRSFIEFSRMSALEPRRDRQTKGLFGSVRFRILFARA